MNYTRHVCTLLNAFLMVIWNIVAEFQDFDIFVTFYEMVNLSSAHACRLESIND